jgi:hypothetical protein
MEVCDGCADIDGRPVDVQRQEVTLIGVAERNGTLALDKCQAIIARRFTGDSDERVWSVIEAAH